MADEDMPDRAFQEAALEPLMWLSAAQRLRRCADLIEPGLRAAIKAYGEGEDQEDIFIAFPYLMLCGMALENLLKGILVGRNPALVEPRRINLKPLRGEHAHDLVKLADEAEVPLTHEQRDFLVRAGEAVLWNGRYPTPTSAAQLEMTGLRRGGHGSRRTYTTRDPLLFVELYDQLADLVRAESEEAEQRRRREEWNDIDS